MIFFMCYGRMDRRKNKHQSRPNSAFFLYAIQNTKELLINLWNFTTTYQVVFLSFQFWTLNTTENKLLYHKIIWEKRLLFFFLELVLFLLIHCFYRPIHMPCLYSKVWRKINYYHELYFILYTIFEFYRIESWFLTELTDKTYFILFIAILPVKF